MLSCITTDRYNADMFLFLWQVFATNKQSYETVRHILVIKVLAGMDDINFIINKQINMDRCNMNTSAVAHREDAALPGRVLHQAEGD